MLNRAHSRQKMSPRWQETGSRAISRHRPHEPKGRKESRFRRAEEEDQADFARARSWEVKTGRDVFRLPGVAGQRQLLGMIDGGLNSLCDMVQGRRVSKRYHVVYKTRAQAVRRCCWCHPRSSNLGSRGRKCAAAQAPD
jgi:hypothetical protein